MALINRRVACFVALALLAFSTAACGDNEPERRKAFITFLQTRVIDRQGVRIPKLSDTEAKAVGDYAQHYAVITGFTGDPELTVLTKKLSEGLPDLRSIQSLVDQRVSIRKVAAELDDVMRAMNTKYDKTLEARNALKQPDDLKTVYSAAFDKTVTAPIQAFRETTPLAQNIIRAAADVGDYVAMHGDSVKIVGGSIQPANRKAQAELEKLTGALSAQGPKFNEAQRKLRAALLGN